MSEPATKACERCGGIFVRASRRSLSRFARRRFCSRQCQTTPFMERFWSKVDARGPDECWPWTASTDGKGYGQMGVAERRRAPIKAHRVSWEMHNGIIPDGLFVLHRCDNRPCCNPAHLFLGTHQDNMDDMRTKSRRRAARGETHCRAKLTAAQVLEIRASATPSRQLAAQFPVSAQHVRLIQQRKTWKHL